MLIHPVRNQRNTFQYLRLGGHRYALAGSGQRDRLAIPRAVD